MAPAGDCCAVLIPCERTVDRGSDEPKDLGTFYFCCVIVPKCNLKTFGYRAFSHRAPALWNALPDDIGQVKLLETFKSKLKTHLFRQFFH